MESPRTKTKTGKSSKLTSAERHKRFVETAKKVEASEDLKEFDRAFDKIGRPIRDARRSSEKCQRS